MLSDLLKRAGQVTNRQSPAILTAIGVTGVVATAYLSAKASFKAADLIRADEVKNGEIGDPVESLKYYAPKVWQLYIPAGITGVTTIGAILYSNRLSSSRTAAAVSAYALTEKAFSQYRDKVVDEIGKHKEQFVRDDIARDSVANNPPGKTIVIGSGEVLCCELHTGRYFMSDMEKLKRAQNEINLQSFQDLYVTLDTFYEMIQIPPTTHSSELGWDSDRLMELEFSTVLTDDGRPCLAFNYSYIKPI